MVVVIECRLNIQIVSHASDLIKQPSAFKPNASRQPTEWYGRPPSHGDLLGPWGQKSVIPPHIGIKTEINPKIPKDLDKRDVHTSLDMTRWSRSEKKRIAAVNNFGATGGDTMLILEEAPSRDLRAHEEDPRPTQVIAISAKTKSSLTGYVQRLIQCLDDNYGSMSLSDLSYTTTARRYHHSYRLAITASSLSWSPSQPRSRICGLPRNRARVRYPQPLRSPVKVLPTAPWILSCTAKYDNVSRTSMQLPGTRAPFNPSSSLWFAC